MKAEDLPDLQGSWEDYKKGFSLQLPLSIEIVDKIIESFKSDITQQRDGEACRVLAERYKTGYSKVIGSQIKKDEYTANLLTLIGKNLGNENCIKIFNLSPTKYEILESTVNNFIQNYIGQSDITFDDAILSAAYSDTLNTSILGDPNYNNMYNHG